MVFDKYKATRLYQWLSGTKENSNKLYMSTVQYVLDDAHSWSFDISQYGVIGVAKEKSMAENFAQNAAPRYHKGKKAKAKAIHCLDKDMNYQDGQDLYIIPELKKCQTSLPGFLDDSIEVKKYYAITSDLSLANKEFTALNQKNNISAHPDQILRTRYIAPKK